MGKIFVLKYFRGLGVTTILYYSLLNIFRAINFRGLSQPRKYFNNENFPNTVYSASYTIQK